MEYREKPIPERKETQLSFEVEDKETKTEKPESEEAVSEAKLKFDAIFSRKTEKNT